MKFTVHEKMPKKLDNVHLLINMGYSLKDAASICDFTEEEIKTLEANYRLNKALSLREIHDKYNSESEEEISDGVVEVNIGLEDEFR